MTSSISGFPFFSFHIPHIPHIPEIPEIFDLGIFPIFIFPFDLGKFDLGIPEIPEIFDLGIFAHFFLVVVSAHFVPIPPFPILLSQLFTQLKQLRKGNLKIKFSLERDSNPRPLRCSALLTELSSQLGTDHFVSEGMEVT